MGIVFTKIPDIPNQDPSIKIFNGNLNYLHVILGLVRRFWFSAALQGRLYYKRAMQKVWPREVCGDIRNFFSTFS